MTAEDVISRSLQIALLDIALIMGRDAFLECLNDRDCLEKLLCVCLENMFYELHNYYITTLWGMR